MNGFTLDGAPVNGSVLLPQVVVDPRAVVMSPRVTVERAEAGPGDEHG
jgi:hypothetical protein